MRRLLATMHCDVRLQVRNGFYYAVVLVLACWGLLMWQLPAFDWRLFLPALVLGNLIMTAFYFIWRCCGATTCRRCTRRRRRWRTYLSRSQGEACHEATSSPNSL